MKPIIIWAWGLAIAAFLLPVQGWTQQFTERGNFVIGTAIGFSSNTSTISQTSGQGEGPESFQWNIAPHVGYFLFENFALGVGLDYTFSREKQPNADKNDDTDLLFGPFGRYYIPFGGDKAVFLEGNFGFGTSSDNLIIDGQPQNISTDIIAFGAGPGFTIFSNDAIGIETLFKYNFARSRFNTEQGGVTTETTTKTNQFAISLGIQVYFAGLRRAH
ncbi:MAG: outer membrane beta-barrel protein [Saprospiraceae bacterium]|nr:outer membrane beta-barrel protein [Saprospiraceae bacterium]